MNDLVGRVIHRWAAPRPQRLYHGTASHYLDDLMEASEVEIYLADTIQGTRQYAEGHAAAGDSGLLGKDPLEPSTPVVLELDVATLDRQGHLGPDWDDVVRDIDQFEAAHVGNVTWLESLEVLGTCSYEGSLSGAVKEVHELDFEYF